MFFFVADVSAGCPKGSAPFRDNSGTKKEHKPKLLSPDIFRWGGGLPHEGVGAKKFGMSLETREIKLFWRETRDFSGKPPAVPEKLENKVFGPLITLTRGMGTPLPQPSLLGYHCHHKHD